ncbi:hypothetical protein J0895_23485 [Phormidium pseudopriestleyi FRX01]|uniref:Uncharacterized protein n=1 Tax=Phormidium pseudopriestleyi FRX01 TaxID=1759528 RepID=A0ABS3FXY5_9CYAN|nr:hypothetical protein [Phormidium pseudopriestleyi]MBO0351989.1 hypothetical protein [Phormidium pseudopriestleyi FRX01]
MGGEFTRKRDRLSYEERGWHPPLYRCDRLHWGHSDVAIARQEEPHPNPDLAKGRGPFVRRITINVKNLLL